MIKREYVKLIMFSHNDHDGKLSAIMAKNWLTKNLSFYHGSEVHYVGYDDILIDIVDPTTIYDYPIINKNKLTDKNLVVFTDYSFSNENKEMMNRCLNSENVDIIWIDHHASSVKYLKDIEYLYKGTLDNLSYLISTRYSACVLTDIFFNKSLMVYEDLLELKCSNSIIDNNMYKYQYPNNLIELVDIFDRFDTKSPNLDMAVCVNYGYTILRHRYDDLSFSYDCFINDDNEKCNKIAREFINEGARIRDYFKFKSNNIAEQYGFEFKINDYNCIALNQKGNSLMFPDDLYYLYDIVWSIVFNGEKWEYNFFTSKDIDCLSIAEHYNGGGHKHAAGFVSDKLIIKKGANIEIDL